MPDIILVNLNEEENTSSEVTETTWNDLFPLLGKVLRQYHTDCGTFSIFSWHFKNCRKLAEAGYCKAIKGHCWKNKCL